jgi:hypothetical protein
MNGEKALIVGAEPVRRWGGRPVGGSKLEASASTAAHLPAKPGGPSPAEQLLRGNRVTPGDLGRHRARRQRLLDNPRLLVRRPAPPPPYRDENLHAQRGNDHDAPLRARTILANVAP